MKTRLLIRSVIAVLALPVMVAGVIPGMAPAGARERNRRGPAEPSESHRGGTGLIFATLGLFLAAGAIRKFSTEGEGTLAPWDPPRKPVVRGTYRYVRNPMISGVVSMLAGQGNLLRFAAGLKMVRLFCCPQCDLRSPPGGTDACGEIRPRLLVLQEPRSTVDSASHTLGPRH
jgi:protein-S-isoprenylcysteine O-methyltransferase Ste14